MPYSEADYLTESQLFDIFLDRPVVHSASWGEIYRYLPRDVVADPGVNGYLALYWQQFEAQVESFDSPAEDLELLIEDLEAYLIGIKKVRQDYMDFKHHCTVMTLPEPAEDCDDNAWVEYEDCQRYVDKLDRPSAHVA